MGWSRRQSLVSRYSTEPVSPFGAWLHSLAGLCNPRGMTRIALLSAEHK